MRRVMMTNMKNPEYIPEGGGYTRFEYLLELAELYRFAITKKNHALAVEILRTMAKIQLGIS